MRVLIFGPTGMLGHQLVREALNRNYQIWAVSRSTRWLDSKLTDMRWMRVNWVGGVDVSGSLEWVRDWIDECQPEVIVNAAGLVKQGPGGHDVSRLMPVNALFPRALQTMVLERATKIIHISTDCVYNGAKGFYRESDVPNALDWYGKSKILGEVVGPRCLTLRTSIVGPEIHSYRGLFEWFRGQGVKTVPGYTRAIFSGVSTVYLARLIWNLAEQFPNLEGLYHIATEPVSKYDLLQLIRDALRLETRIVPDDTVMCDRSLNAAKFFHATGIVPPPWPKMVYDLLESSPREARS